MIISLVDSDSDSIDSESASITVEQPPSASVSTSEQPPSTSATPRKRRATRRNYVDYTSDYNLSDDHEEEVKSKRSKSSGAAEGKKGKGKGKARKSIDEDDAEAEVGMEYSGKGGKGRRVSKAKKELLAEECTWKDIPKWGDRTDCPLLQLPSEVLDRCFALNMGLEKRDYVALAGVNRMFRTQMTDDVWKEISNPPWLTKFASRIISQSVDDWRKEPLVYVPDHERYKPRGERSTWTKAQYTVYKEEREHWIETTKRRRAEEAARSAVCAMDRRKHPHSSVVLASNDYSYTVLRSVPGRMNGEPPVACDKNGLPLQADSPPAQESPEQPIEEEEGEATAVYESEKAMQFPSSAVREPEMPSVPNAMWGIGRAATDPVYNRPDTSSYSEAAEPWSVPMDDEDPVWEPKINYDNNGKVIPHDYWHSFFRDAVVKTLAFGIGKIDAKQMYGVTEAQLLCLKSVSIGKSRAGSSWQTIYNQAAVEALAFRAHGGVKGHHDFLEARRKKAEKAANARRFKQQEQQEEQAGTDDSV